MGPCGWTRGPAIGSGSSAVVSLAMTEDGEVLAVKSAELARAYFLQREQSFLSEISSPRIVSYVGHDTTTENGKKLYNLFMEYVPGGNLSDEIKRRGGRIEEPDIQAVTRGILQGMAYLHSMELVHCDIKGHNILMGLDGPKIADLGCAKRIREAGGVISGTPLYMAPEVARGEEQGFAADVWSLGCTMIEMATGRTPWTDAVDPISALYQIAYSVGVPEFPTCLSEQAKDFLNKCLRRNPEERWTANELLKHPFVEESKKQIQSSSILENSPTSTLEQGFWDFLEDGQAEMELTQVDFPVNQSLSERIRLLCGANSPLPTPEWIWEEEWVTVRENEEIESFSTEAEMGQITISTTSTASVRPDFTCDTDELTEFGISSGTEEIMFYSNNASDTSEEEGISISGGKLFVLASCSGELISPPVELYFCTVHGGKIHLLVLIINNFFPKSTLQFDSLLGFLPELLGMVLLRKNRLANLGSGK